MIKRTFFGIVIGLALGCSVEQPQGGGRIHTRCRIVGGDASAVYPCGTGQYALCELGSDAGNGELFSICCNSNETEATCARSAGISSDGGTINQ